MKKEKRYYDILQSAQSGDEATILLYGYIGEEYRYMDGGYEETGVTDVAFVNMFTELQAKCKRINVRINSYGGEVFHGAAIVTALQGATCEVHTYVDGVAASMAAAIFLAGKQRHMSPGSMLMLHCASAFCWGNANEMMDCSEALKKFDESLIAGIASSTGMDPDTIRSQWFNYKDNWLTAAEAESAGLLAPTEPDEFPVKQPYELPEPEELKAMDYASFVKHVRAKATAQHSDTPTLLGRIRNAFQNSKKVVSSITSPINDDEMNIDQFKAALQEGKLSAAEVEAHLTEVKQSDPVAVASAQQEALKAELAALKQQVEALGKQAGDTKTQPGLPANDPEHVSAEMQEYQRFDAMLREAAGKFEALKVTPN
jgi:ATP-dependent protease ClpP protease subunit